MTAWYAIPMRNPAGIEIFCSRVCAWIRACARSVNHPSMKPPNLTLIREKSDQL
jgi:hypothetical protein